MNNINIAKIEILSADWSLPKKVTYENTDKQDQISRQCCMAYDGESGAVILLYNKVRRTVILTRQFRIPVYLNSNTDNTFIERCSGLLNCANTEDCTHKEMGEKAGFHINKVTKVFEAYMSPGSVTELLHFFTGEYDHAMKISEYCGIEDEDEQVEVLEIYFGRALRMIESGEIQDAKTIMLLQYAQIQKLF